MLKKYKRKDVNWTQTRSSTPSLHWTSYVISIHYLLEGELSVTKSYLNLGHKIIYSTNIKFKRLFLCHLYAVSLRVVGDHGFLQPPVLCSSKQHLMQCFSNGAVGRTNTP